MRLLKKNIKSMLEQEIEQELLELGEPKFRAKQIFKWLHSGAKSFEEMTNLPQSLRSRLDEGYYITVPKVLKKQVSKQDGTIKYLWELIDGNSVESVVMRYRYGNTICISSQVGCRMGCAFCASTIGGRVRDLEASEMLDQVLFAELDSGLKINNIVLMGIGEPLDNFDNVMRFLKLVNSKDGLNIGMRHITISTCGLIEKVDKLGDYNIQSTLTISLHAADDETRSRIMPVNKAAGVDRLLAAAKRYFEKTGRRVSFEYSMIDGVNDTEYHARQLAQKLKGTGSHVNLILLNEVAESPFHPSTQENLRKFIDILEKNSINVTVRRKLGGDIEASCGQLRRKIMGNRRDE